MPADLTEVHLSCPKCVQTPAVSLTWAQAMQGVTMMCFGCAGRVVLQITGCCLYTGDDTSSSNCNPTAISYNSATQSATIQAGTLASFTWPVSLSAPGFNSEGVCSYNMTVNFQVGPLDMRMMSLLAGSCTAGKLRCIKPAVYVRGGRQEQNPFPASCLSAAGCGHFCCLPSWQPP